MMKTYLLFLIGILFACENDCKNDLEFKRQFENAIRVIELTENGASVRFKHRVNSFECLQAITGQSIKVERDGDTPYFYKHSPTTDYYKDDQQSWKRWYANKKCAMTMLIADSLIAARGEEIGWDLTWPPPFDIVVADSVKY